ncbi:MAG: hypothetical protein LQ347_006346 [Umbilicaria vellea]|nr:MAG: hypothetical protein LQ347_006346 [Umbilicaria vellea]
MANGPRLVRYRKSWNPFVCTLEIPYTVRKLVRMDDEKDAQRIDPVQPAAEPVGMPVQVACETGEPQAMLGPPPAYTFCCQQCCGCYVNAVPYPWAPVNAVPGAAVAGDQHPTPNPPSVNVAQQQPNKKNNANKSNSEVKASRREEAEAQQHKKPGRAHSAFKTTNTAHDVKNVSWAMHSDDSSSSDSTVRQQKKVPDRVLPSLASSASRRAVKVAAEALMADDNDLDTVSDSSSAVDDESKIPHRTTYDKRGSRTENRKYRPRDSDLESDSSSSTSLDDSPPHRRRHRSREHSTNTRQNKRRNKKHPHASNLNKWQGDTSSSSGDDNNAPPVRSHYNSKNTTYTRQDKPRKQNYPHSSASQGQEYVDNGKSDRPHNQNYQHSSTPQGQEYVDNWKSDRPHNQNYPHSSTPQGQECVDNRRSDRPHNQNHPHSSASQGQEYVDNWRPDRPHNQNYQHSSTPQGQEYVDNWRSDRPHNQDYQHSSTPQGQAWNNRESDKARNQNYPHSSASHGQAWGNNWDWDKSRNQNDQNSTPSQGQAWINNWESDKPHYLNHQHSSAPQQQQCAVDGIPEPSAGFRNNNVPHSSTAQRQEYVDNWKADTRSDSDNGIAIDNRVPRYQRPTTGGTQPQPRQVIRSSQGLPNNNHMGASDNRIPKIRLPSPAGRQPRRRQGTWSTQNESDSTDSTIDNRVPEHRRSTNSDSRSQSRYRSTQGVSGGVQGRANNHVSSSRREQHSAIERGRSPSPFGASSHLDTTKRVGYDLFSDPLWRVTDDDPMSSYHNAIAQRAMQEAYQHGLSQSRSSTVKKEADSRPKIRGGHGSHKSTKDTRNSSPHGTPAQSRSGSREPDYRVESTRRGDSEYRRKHRKQSSRSYSPSPDREQWSPATSDAESEPHLGYRERHRHPRHRSPTPPPTPPPSHKHSRKNRRSGSPSSKARSDPNIITEDKGNNADLIFIQRTKAQKITTQAGEGLHLKRAVSGVDRPSAPSYRSDFESGPKKVRHEMSGGLGIGDKKKPKRSSKYRPPTVASDSSDEYPIHVNSAGVTWRDV